MATLYERLGGQGAISSVIDKFYVYMLSDPITAPFFANTDMEKQRAAQKTFIGMITGGPQVWNGLDMKKAHHNMNIGQKEFDETWLNLVKSMNDHNVPQDLIDELK